ncbi:MAG: flagellar export chaperone FliS [Rhodospirillaceae bacterium]|nr:MAG: flagellar export chaperone FliS [Rhodospirillaceae bacterium]
MEKQQQIERPGKHRELSAPFEGSMNYGYNEIMTASQSHLIVMLYREALAALKASVAAIERGDIEARWRASTKATDILAHLHLTLDFHRGGRTAKNLGRIYRYILQRLLSVNIKNDAKPAQEGARLLEPLLNSWEDLDIQISHSSEGEFSTDRD